jgi:hypothetical protein
MVIVMDWTRSWQRVKDDEMYCASLCIAVSTFAESSIASSTNYFQNSSN